MEDFLKRRAPEAIQKNFINKFDEIAKYFPLVYAEVNITRTKEVIKKEIVYKEIKRPVITSEETMVKYLKDKGWICYKKK